MGFHSYLQKIGVPFSNPVARGINTKIFSTIKGQAEDATRKLAKERGSCPDAKNAGIERRNIYLLAIAPNASSSIICGNTSPSIEPIRANAYTHKTMSGSFLVKNPYLETKLKSIGKNTKEVWKSIILNKGSVQHLDFLDSWDKDVFKTAMEIDQKWLVQHASDRQPFICQAQSLNLFFTPDSSVKYLHDVHVMAWKSGLKTLYYCRSESIGKVESISEQIERKEVKEDSTCLGCEG
jgi:ribonucleoside-diphosphate reductase alpha chain